MLETCNQQLSNPAPVLQLHLAAHTMTKALQTPSQPNFGLLVGTQIRLVGCLCRAVVLKQI